MDQSAIQAIVNELAKTQSELSAERTKCTSFGGALATIASMVGDTQYQTEVARKALAGEWSAETEIQF